MLKIRKYIEGEVIESNIIETESQPATDNIQSKINLSLQVSKVKLQNADTAQSVINNIDIMNCIDTGVIYKNFRNHEEFAVVGSRELKMQLLGKDVALSVIVPPMCIYISGDVAYAGIRMPGVPLNPFPNVFGGRLDVSIAGKSKQRLKMSLNKLCLGDNLENKVRREFNGTYTASAVLTDWLVSRPNTDLSLTVEFSFQQFKTYINQSFVKGLITRDQMKEIAHFINNRSWNFDIDQTILWNYNYLIILMSAFAAYSPDIAADLIPKSYIKRESYEHSMDIKNVISFLNNF